MAQTEEFITKAILKYLDRKKWHILAFDYPQSGAGISFQPDRRGICSKNLGMITPDVVAMKHSFLLFLENKPGFYEPDVTKLRAVKDGLYSESIRKVLGLSDFIMNVGIGIGESCMQRRKALSHVEVLDIILWVDGKGDTYEAYSRLDL